MTYRKQKQKSVIHFVHIWRRMRNGYYTYPLIRQRPLLLIGRRESAKLPLWNRRQQSAVWDL